MFDKYVWWRIVAFCDVTDHQEILRMHQIMICVCNEWRNKYICGCILRLLIAEHLHRRTTHFARQQDGSVGLEQSACSHGEREKARFNDFSSTFGNINCTNFAICVVYFQAYVSLFKYHINYSDRNLATPYVQCRVSIAVQSPPDAPKYQISALLTRNLPDAHILCEIRERAMR